VLSRAVWFCAKASLRGRRPLCFLGAVYLGMVGIYIYIYTKVAYVK